MFKFRFWHMSKEEMKEELGRLEQEISDLYDKEKECEETAKQLLPKIDEIIQKALAEKDREKAKELAKEYASLVRRYARAKNDAQKYDAQLRMAFDRLKALRQAYKSS